MNNLCSLLKRVRYLFALSALTGAVSAQAQNSEWRATLNLGDPSCGQSVPYVPQGAPVWFSGLWVDGGLFSASGWGATNAATDTLVLEIAPAELTNNLALTACYSGGASVTGTVKICDAELLPLSTNIAVRNGEPVALPFDTFPEGVCAVFSVPSTNVTVWSLSLAVDDDLDGLDAGEEAAVGTSDQNPDSDGDGYTDLYEFLCGTAPLNPASIPAAQIMLFVPDDQTLEAPSTADVGTAGCAVAAGNGFTPTVTWIDAAHPDLKTGFLAAFRLDGAGDFLLVDGYGTLHLTGTVCGALSGVPGRIGDAFSFSGYRQYISLGAPDALNTEPLVSPIPPGMPPPTNANARFSFSISAWVRPLATDGFRNIVAHGYKMNPDAELSLRVNAGKYEYQAWKGSAGQACVSFAVPSEDVGNWVHLVGVYDGAAWSLYRNGSLAAQVMSSVTPPVSDAAWAIGAAGNGNERFFKGDIDDVGIWNRALSSAEVSRIWRAGADGMSAASLVSGVDRQWMAAHPSGTPLVSAVQKVRIVDRIPPSFTAPQDVALGETTGTDPAHAGAPSSVFDLADPSPRVFWRDREIPYPSSIVLWYPFDEEAGAAKFSEGLGRGSGYPVGGVSSGISGVTGGSVAFDGALGRVSLGGCDALSSLVSGFTVAAWVKPSSIPSAVASVLTSKKDGWALGFRDGRFRFDLCNIRASETVVPVTVGEWCHIAASYDTNSTVKLYFNGAPVSTQSNTVSFVAGSGGWFVGGAGDRDRCFPGAVDDLAVWKEVRSDGEIASLYLTGREGASAALVDSAGRATRALLRRWTVADFAALEASSLQWIFLSDTEAPSIVAPPDFTAMAPSSVGPSTAGWPQVTDNADPSPSVVWRDCDNAISKGLRLRLNLVQPPPMYDGWAPITDDAGWYSVSGIPMHTVSVEDGLPQGVAAMGFNGTSAILTLGNPEHMNFSGSFSVSAWIRPLATDGVRNILAHGFRFNPCAETSLRIESGKYSFVSWDGTNHGVTASVPAEDIGRWVHITGTCDGHVWRLYRDGVLFAFARDEFGAMSMSADWAVGGRAGANDRLFKGDIRNVCLWSRALLPGEIAVLHSLEAAGGCVAHDLPLPANGLALYLPMDEVLPGPVAKDISTNAYRPEVRGPVALYDNGMTFNGSNTWLKIGNPTNMNFSGPFSVVAWVKPSQASMSGLRNILAHGHRFNPNGDTGLRVNNGRYTFYSWNGSDHGVSSAVPTSNVAGAWLHVAGTYDGAVWRLYYDGVLVASVAETNSGAVAMSADWAVGSRGTGTDRFFAGGLRGVGLWSRSLSADEIRAVRSATQASGDPGFDAMPDRRIVRTWTATDRAGNSASASQQVTVTDALDRDSDGDGLFDLEEEFTGTDPLKSDTDDDGYSDFTELTVFGTDPAKADTDGDVLPDKWEIDNGTDPLVFDVWDDPDRDGLCNFDEWQAGTDPVRADTDSDGASDGLEVRQILTDPLVVDFDMGGYAVLGAVSGSAGVGQTGSWVADGGSVRSVSRSGTVAFQISLDAPGTFMAVFSVRQNNIYTAQDTFDLTLTVDGLPSGRQVFYAPAGSWSEAFFVLPPLKEGAHELKLTWWNTRANTFLEVGGFEVRSYGGTDSDGDGVPDWLETRVARASSLTLPSANGWVSPVCVEGSGRYLSLASVGWETPQGPTNAVPEPGVGDRWFIDVPLLVDAATPVVVTAYDGASVITNALTWEPFDLSVPPTNAVVLRARDALLLADSSGARDYAVTFDGNAFTNLTLSASPVPFGFPAAGDYVIAPSSGGAGQPVAVRAVAASFGGGVLCIAGRERVWACPGIPSESVCVDYDQRFNLGAAPLETGGMNFTLLSLSADTHRMVARLGEDGPVLDSATVWFINNENGSYWREVELFPDGVRAVEVRLQLGEVPADIRIELQIVVAGVTFEDGSLFKVLTAADFDADGVCRYRLLQSPGSATSTCHSTKVYQGNVLVGSS